MLLVHVKYNDQNDELCKFGASRPMEMRQRCLVLHNLGQASRCTEISRLVAEHIGDCTENTHAPDQLCKGIGLAIVALLP